MEVPNVWKTQCGYVCGRISWYWSAYALSAERTTLNNRCALFRGSRSRHHAGINGIFRWSNQRWILNPALTLGFWSARKLETVTAVMYIIAQMLGAWGAYYLYTYFVNNKLEPVGGDFSWRILIAEGVGTAVFAMGVAAAVQQGLTRAATSAYVGVSLMVGAIAASSAAIGMLNPAVALGARAWVLSTYVLGPILGAIIGVNLYHFLFAEAEKDAVVEDKVPASAVVAKPKTSKGASKKKTTRVKK